MSPKPRRRLDLEMVRRQLVAGRTEARTAILAGRVAVEGVTTPKPATLVDEASVIRVLSPSAKYVSRGGAKLAGAFEDFGIPVTDRNALDVGASTGGFTDYLLQNGATSVVAVDVGYGQLDWSLRTDQRVTVHDRLNLRNAVPGDLGGPFEIVVGDLSFISLCAVADQIAALTANDGDAVLLVKPQFEVGKGEVGKGGIVRDPDKHRKALERVIKCLDAAGLGVRAVTASPITGAKGNKEFFVWAQRGAATVQGGDLDEVVRR
jgi:23S rRNA (cytidine1920-2'-O)/16S rRNA (cytidine1409-2'-O)-methyltransferase